MVLLRYERAQAIEAGLGSGAVFFGPPQLIFGHGPPPLLSLDFSNQNYCGRGEMLIRGRQVVEPRRVRSDAVHVLAEFHLKL